MTLGSQGAVFHDGSTAGPRAVVLCLSPLDGPLIRALSPRSPTSGPLGRRTVSSAGASSVERRGAP